MNAKEHIYKLYAELIANEQLFHWLFEPSDEQNVYWEKIMHDDPIKRKAINDLKTIFKYMEIEEESITEESKNELWKKIETVVEKRQKRNWRIAHFLRYAAMLLVLIALSIYFFMQKEAEEETSPINYEQLLSEILLEDKEANHVMLILDNNEKIAIKENKAELTYDKEGRVHINSQLIKQNEYIKEPRKSFNQLYVPYGKTTSLRMNDGTKIWVNSGSKIIYPSSFTGNRREIFVDGEIYLEVAKNTQAPFIVKTGLLDVEVLGTSFNVSAYSSDDDQHVVLASGSVAVKENEENRILTMSPNNKYTYEKDSHNIAVRKVDPQDYTSWRFGFLSLNNERLEHVLKRIERFYNVQIDFMADPSDNNTLSGKLDLKENLEETFRILSITVPINYSIRENTVNVKVKP